jgi:hypothetical protein
MDGSLHENRFSAKRLTPIGERFVAGGLPDVSAVHRRGPDSAEAGVRHSNLRTRLAMIVSTSERTTDTRSMIRQPRPPPRKRGPSPPPKTIILIAAQSSALTWSPSSRAPVALTYRVAYPATPLANPGRAPICRRDSRLPAGGQSVFPQYRLASGARLRRGRQPGLDGEVVRIVRVQNTRRYEEHPWHTVGGQGVSSEARNRRYGSSRQMSDRLVVVRSPSTTRSSPITMQHGCTTPRWVM